MMAGTNAFDSLGRHLFGRLGEHLYTDTAPRWEGAPTADKVQADRRFLAKRLQRWPVRANFPGAAKLCEILSACAPYYRCHSGACPACDWAQQWNIACYVASLTSTFVSRLTPSGVAAVAVTIVPDGWQQSVGSLAGFRISKELRAVRDICVANPTVRATFLGVDFSLNDDRQKKSGTQ